MTSRRAVRALLLLVCAMLVHAADPVVGQSQYAAPRGHLIYRASFDDGSSNDWQGSATPTLPVTTLNGRPMLGPIQTQAAVLAVTNLPPHSSLTLTFSLAVLGSWDGTADLWEVGVDGATLMKTSFSNFGAGQHYPQPVGPIVSAAQTGAFERNSLQYPGGDAIYRFTLTVPHSATKATVVLEALNDEFWALDDVEVFVVPLGLATASWGANQTGQLGLGMAGGPFNTPTAVTGAPALSSLTAMGPWDSAAGHSLALDPQGGVWAWGANGSNQLGVSGNPRVAPTPVPAGNIAAIATGTSHTIALTTAGGVISWGSNAQGQLGDGSLSVRSDIVAIAAGDAHGLALTATGTVLAWGRNSHGELGRGSAGTGSNIPVPVGLTGVMKIAAGRDYSLALRSNGELWAWGRNQAGQLGQPVSGENPNPSPLPVPAGGARFVAMSGGFDHMLAIDTLGRVWAWGSNTVGQLGRPNDGSCGPLAGSGLCPTPRLSDTTLPLILDVYAGGYHSLVRAQDGSVWAWGRNQQGQLGEGSSLDQPSPVRVSGVAEAATLAAGAHHSLALAPPPAPLVAPTSLSFAPVYVIVGSESREVSLANNGGMSLRVTAVAVSGANAPDFVAIGCGVGVSVEPGSACTTTITFSPRATGTRSADLTIATDAGTYVIPLFGEALGDTVGPTITIERPGTGPYAQGATVLAQFACTDDETGIASGGCVGTVLNGAPIDTTTPGYRVFGVTARDNGGNTSEAEVLYQVMGPSPSGRPNITWMRGGHSSYFAGLAATPSGSLVASMGADGTLKLWRGSDGILLKTIRAHGGGTAVAVTNDGSHVASAGGGNTKIWRVADGSQVGSVARDARWLAFSPDGQYVATADAGLAPNALWRLDGTPVREFGGLDGSTGFTYGPVAFSPDGQWLATSVNDTYTQYLILYSLTNPGIHRHFGRGTGGRVAFSRDGQVIAGGSTIFPLSAAVMYTGVVHSHPDGGAYQYGIFGPSLGTPGTNLGVQSSMFSPDGATFLAGGGTSQANAIRGWNWAHGDLVADIPGHAVGAEPSVAYGAALPSTGDPLAPKRPTFVSAGFDFKRWFLEPGFPFAQRLSAHGDEVNAVLFSPDGTSVASAGTIANRDQAVRIWKAADGHFLREIDAGGEVSAMALSPDGAVLATAVQESGSSGTVTNHLKLWSYATGELLRSWTTQRFVKSAAFTPDGQRIALGGETISVYRVSDGQILLGFFSNSDVLTLAISPDGATLATGGHFGIQLWNIAPSATEYVLGALSPEAHITALAYSLDGQSLAVARRGADNVIGDIDIWSTTGTLLRTLSGHANWVNGIAFGSDGRLGSVGRDATVRLWDPATGESLAVYDDETSGHGDPSGLNSTSIAFARQGPQFVYGRADGTIVMAEREVATAVPTTLGVSPATGSYGATVGLTATLASAGAPVPGRTVSFSLNGTHVGSAVTDATGVASLQSVALGTIAAAVYPTGVTATFAGDSMFLASTSYAPLQVLRAVPIVTWPAPAPFNVGAALSAAQLNAAANVPGSFGYEPREGTVLPLGTHELLVEFVPADIANYTPVQASVSIDVLDGIAPSIVITRPADGAEYAQDDFLVASYTCVDGESKVTSCRGPMASGDRIETTTLGLRTFTVTAIDQAGNTSTATATYRVTKREGRSYAYATNRQTGQVLVVELGGTPRVVGAIAAGSHPYGIAITPDGGKAYVADHLGGEVVVLDLVTDTVVARIPVGVSQPSRPTNVAMAPNGKSAYVTCQFDDSVVEVDTVTDTVVRRLPVGAAPFDVAINPNGLEAYVTHATDNILAILDLTTGTIRATLPIGQNPQDVVVSPDGLRVFVATQDDGRIWSVDPVAVSVVASAEAGSNAANLAITPDGSLLFVSFARPESAIASFDATTLAPRDVVEFATFASGMTVTEDGTRLIALGNDSTITVFDLAVFPSQKASGLAPSGLHGIGVLPGPLTTTALVDVGAGAVFGQAALLTATLQAESAAIAGRTLNFYVGGAYVGTAITDANGVAMLDGVSTAGFSTGVSVDAIVARFPGAPGLQPGEGSGDLVVAQSEPTLTWTPTPIAAGAPLGTAQLSAVANVPGTFDYSPAAGTVLPVGEHVLAVMFTPEDSANYTTAFLQVTIVILDGSPPSIMFSAPVDGAAYELHQTVLASYQCADAASPVVSCIGSVAAGTGIDTGTLGTKTFTVTGTDALGNVATTTVTYTVRKRAEVAYLYAPNRRRGEVTILDPTTASVVGTIAGVGLRPNGIAITPDGRKAYVAHELDHEVIVLDLTSDTVLRRIPFGDFWPSNPNHVALSPDGSRLYVTTRWDAALWEIDTATDQPTRRFGLGTEAIDVAIAPSGRTAYVTLPAAAAFAIVDLDSGATTFKTVSTYPRDVVVSPDGRHVYVATQAGHIWHLDTATDTLRNVEVGSNAGSLAISPDGERLYLAWDTTGGALGVFLTSTLQEIHRQWFGIHPTGLAISEDGRRLYANGNDSGITSIIDTADFSTVDIAVPDGLHGLAYIPGSRADTAVTSVSGSAVYGGLATLTATLVSGPSPVAGKTLNFALNGMYVGSAVTGSSGQATLPGVSVVGLSVGVQGGVLSVTFPGAAGFVGSQNAGDVTIQRATPVITWPTPGPVTVGTALSTTQLNATANVPGSVVYTPAAGFVVSNSVPHTLSASFSPADGTKYLATTASVVLQVQPAPTTLTLALSSTEVSVAQAVTLTAVLSVPPLYPFNVDGRIDFFDGDTLLGSSTSLGNSGGTATTSITRNFSGAGPRTLTARYTGSSRFLPSNANITQVDVTPSERHYAFVELGTLGGSISYAWGINAAGVIAGNSNLAGDQQSHAFIYTQGVMTDLGTLGGSFSTAMAINDRGWVTGHSSVAGNTGTHAFLYRDGVMVDLGALGGNSFGRGINSAGDVVGTSFLAPASSVTRAFLYHNGTMVNLGSLGGNSSAVGIDDAGRVYGNWGSPVRAFVYENGEMRAFEPPDGAPLSVTRVTRSGDVIGERSTPDDTRGFLYRDGVFHDLGSISRTLRPKSLNATTVVGEGRWFFPQSRAALLDGGSALDLEALMSQVDLVLNTAEDINDAGVIVGWGVRAADPNRPRAYLLSPQRLTSLGVSAVSVPFAALANLNAELRSDGLPVVGKAVMFSIEGNQVGQAVTDQQGVATLSNLSLGGRAAGSYPGAITAGFVADLTHVESTASADLTVVRATPVIAWATPAEVIDGTVLSSAQLNATANVAGTIAYAPPAGTILRAGTVLLTAIFTPADPANYESVTTTVAQRVAPPLLVTVTTPVAGGRVFGTSSYLIEWTASGGVGGGPATFEVSLSIDSGVTYSPLQGCVSVPGAVRSCVWSAPAPATSKARIRVKAIDAADNSVADATDGDFTVTTQAPSVTVTSPGSGVVWQAESQRLVTWTHNLGAGSLVRLEVSLDGGTNWSLIAAEVANAGVGSGSYLWTVSSTPTSIARIRVSWNNGPAAGLSPLFTVQTPNITILNPSSPPLQEWVVGKPKDVKFKSTLPAGITLTIQVSRDGGPWQTIGSVLSIGAGTQTWSWQVTGPGTAVGGAQLRVLSPTGVTGLSSPFTIKQKP
jgi:probable HAF family extracellular repeat protein/YVTN family beta-propeller protein